MKVLHFDTENRVVRVELTRRNLLALLAKLDHNLHLDDPQTMPELDPKSLCSIISPNDGPGTVTVVAVEDEEHYADREPGPMLDNATGELY